MREITIKYKIPHRLVAGLTDEYIADCLASYIDQAIYWIKISDEIFDK